MPSVWPVMKDYLLGAKLVLCIPVESRTCQKSSRGRQFHPCSAGMAMFLSCGSV